MSRVLALELDATTREALDEHATAWGVTVEHEHATSGLRRLHRDGAIALVVVGEVADPVRAVQRTQMASPGLPVVVIGSDEECREVTEALKFTPFVSGEVTCLPRSFHGPIVAEIGRVIDRASRRRAHEITLESLNQQIADQRIGPSQAAAGVLGSLLEVAPIGVVLMSERAIVRAINPRGLELLGSGDTSLLGRRLWEELSPDQAERAQSLLAKIDEHPGSRPYEIVAAGRCRLHVSGARLTERAGGPGYLLILQDVTERQTLIEQLRDADRRKDEFLAMLGHELRNPLAPIRTAVELMRLRGDAGSEREREIIERQVRHLVELVDDLLDVSRITRGALELRRHPLETSVFVAQAIEMAGPLIEQRRHTLKVDVPRRGLLVSGDNRRLAQVVSNLLTNAAKYTPPGGFIFVTARREDDTVHLSVRDTGPGIDPALLPVIFDVFVQSKRGPARREGGLGIGLTIVRSLVEMHGGRVEVASEPGQGAEFHVWLPALEVAPPESDREPEHPGWAPNEEALRVLVVDDNEDAAMLLSEIMKSAGYATEIAYDGPSALERAASFKPDLGILDIGLPVMNGYELAGRLRELPGLEHIGLIAVTGYGGELDRTRSQKAGFQDHLVKPVTTDVLLPAVQRVAGTRQRRR